MITDWTTEELQEIELMVKSWSWFAQYLNISEAEAQVIRKEREIKTPTEYVRARPNSEIVGLLLRTGSFERTARRYGVSTSFLRQYLKKEWEEGSIAIMASMTRILREPVKAPEGTVWRMMQRYLSARFTARMMQSIYGDYWTESRVRYQAKAEGFDLKRCIDGHDKKYNNSFGRQAERKFEELRGDAIIEDKNKDDGPSAEYDFLDSLYGRVNVKASRAHKRKDGTRYWKFSTSGLEKAHVVAMMFYDEEGTQLCYWNVSSVVGCLAHRSITIEENLEIFARWGIKEYASTAAPAG